MKKLRRLAVFIAESLDGYIAKEDDSLDWLFKVDGEGDNGYSEFYADVDTVLLGRRTYDWILQHVHGDFPYKDKECYVFSRKANQNNHDVKFINGDIVPFINQLKNKEGKSIWLVGGSELIHSFLKEVDELIITIAPAIIGKGISLFKEDAAEIELSLKEMKRYNQFAALHYEVKK